MAVLQSSTRAVHNNPSSAESAGLLLKHIMTMSSWGLWESSRASSHSHKI